jgi:hypothetical protein
MDGIKEVDELCKYLSLLIERVHNPLAWWWEHHHTYPQLSAMAFDFLSAPCMYCLLVILPSMLIFGICESSGTSTAVEHVFSKGQQLLLYTRNRLSPASIHSLLCIGDWSRKDLVHMPDLVEAIGGKKKSGKQVFEDILSMDGFDD